MPIEDISKKPSKNVKKTAQMLAQTQSAVASQVRYRKIFCGGGGGLLFKNPSKMQSINYIELEQTQFLVSVTKTYARVMQKVFVFV